MPEKLTKFLIPISIVIAGLLIAGAFVYVNWEKAPSNTYLSSQEAAGKAINYINENKDTVAGGQTASLLGVVEEGDLYKIRLKIGDGEYDSSVTKDGKFLFPRGYDLDATTTRKTENGTAEIPKNDNPTVELFVMSFCPYGNQAEDTMLPVYNLLKDKVDWKIHYIVSVDNDTVSSLHGQPEVDQDEREVCVLRDFGLDKWWQFATYVNDNCGSNGVCWQDAAQSAGLDDSVIENCVSSQGLSLMKDEAAASNAAGVSGSPTLIINGVKTNSVYQYGNSQAYLDAICSGFTSAPEGCSQQLSTKGSNPSSSGSCQ